MDGNRCKVTGGEAGIGRWRHLHGLDLVLDDLRQSVAMYVLVSGTGTRFGLMMNQPKELRVPYLLIHQRAPRHAAGDQLMRKDAQRPPVRVAAAEAVLQQLRGHVD